MGMPTQVAALRNTAKAADTSFFSSDLGPVGSTPTTYRVTVAISAALKLNLIVINGGTTYTLRLNGDVALAADTLYTFDVTLQSGNTFNLQVTGGGATVRICEINSALYW